MNKQYHDSTLLALIGTAIVVCIALALAYNFSGDYVPSRIASFCQASHEVYGSSFDECIASYKQRR